MARMPATPPRPRVRLSLPAARAALAALAVVASPAALGCAPTRSSPAPVARTAAPPAATTCGGEARVDVLAHDVRLEVGAGRLDGQGRIRVRTRAGTGVVALDVRGLEVDEASVARQRLAVHTEHDRVCVTLARAVAAGTELELELRWRAREAGAGEGLHFFHDQVWAGYTTPSWMPTVLAAAQRATLRLDVVTAPGLEVLASGLPEGERVREPDGRERRRFVVATPAPPFLFAFAAGAFAVTERRVGEAVLRAYAPAGRDVGPALDRTERALRLFERRLGSPLPGGRYGQAFVHGDAAQEAVGMALIGEDAIAELARDPSEDWVFSHELAHQWFARALPCADFADFWLNEGFATFLVAVAKEEALGAEAYERELELWRTRSRKVTAAGKDAPLAPGPGAPPAADPEPGPRGVTYARGALVLHRLRRELGEARFWAGLARYVADQTGRSPRSEDLRRALEAATGEDLRPFFARWVYAVATEV